MTERTYEKIAAGYDAVGQPIMASCWRALIAERDAARAEGVRAGLEAAADVCDCATMDSLGDAVRGRGDEILALAADPTAVSAIVAGMKGDQDDQ